MNDLTRYALKPGDLVVVKGWAPSPALEVVDTSDAALLTLRTASSAEVRVGRLVCVRVTDVGNRAPIQNIAPAT